MTIATMGRLMKKRCVRYNDRDFTAASRSGAAALLVDPGLYGSGSTTAPSLIFDAPSATTRSFGYKCRFGITQSVPELSRQLEPFFDVGCVLLIDNRHLVGTLQLRNRALRQNHDSMACFSLRAHQSILAGTEGNYRDSETPPQPGECQC